MKKLIFIITLTLFICGCKPLLLKMYGIKNPDIENEKTIKKKALKYRLDTTNIVTVNTKDFLKEFSHGIPDAAIFNSAGDYIEYRQTDTSCNAGLFQFIPELNLTSAYKKTGKTNLTTELTKFRDLKGRQVKTPEKADFYLFIYWTTWTGKLNKDHVKIWEDLATKNKNCNVKVIKVNLDFQEYWDKAERESIIIKLSKKK